MDDVQEDVDFGVPRGLLDVSHKVDAVMEKDIVHQDNPFLEERPVGDDPVALLPPMEDEFRGMAYLHSLQRPPHQAPAVRDSSILQVDNPSLRLNY